MSPDLHFSPIDSVSNNGLSCDRWPAAIYAVGDVHGCLDELRALEAMIVTDGQTVEGNKLIVMLGDYIDRGPASSGVISHLASPPPQGFARISLGGNHDQAMLDAMGGEDRFWLEFGGLQTLQSYGIDPETYLSAPQPTRRALMRGHVPAQHVAFLAALPDVLVVGSTVFAHAGIRRGIPIARQTANDLRWIRDDFLKAAPTDGLLVIHGHTPAAEIAFAPGRIGVDTAAFATGRLSAVRLIENAEPKVFTTGP